MASAIAFSVIVVFINESFFRWLLLHCHDTLGSLRIMAGERADIEIFSRDVRRVEGNDLAFAGSEQFGMREHFLCTRRNVIVRGLGCGFVQKGRLDIAGIYY